MADYRLYSGNGGHFESARWFVATDDEQAIKLAIQLEPDRRCEVWLHERLVAMIERGRVAARTV